MIKLDLLEDYFVKLHKNYGISNLQFCGRNVKLDEKFMRNMVFYSDDFNQEYENLLEHCNLVYQELQRAYKLKIQRDMNNNYFVLVA